MRAKQYELCIYTRYLPECKSPQLSRAKIQEVRSGRNDKKGQEEGEGIRNLMQRSHSTIPSRFDATGGCSRHVVSPTLCLFSTFFRTDLALARANRRVPLSLSFLHPLCPFLHPSADQGTFHSAG